MGQCRPWDPGSISRLQHRASCTCSLKDIFMLLSFQFSAWQAIMCPGVRALLCPEMVPCEKHSVGCLGQRLPARAGESARQRRFGTRCEGPEEVGADLVDSTEPAVFFHEEE